MAKFVIPSDPALNIQNVNEILETDPVLASFINGYFQQLLENDQALKNLIKKRPPKEELARVASTGSYNDLADKPKIPSGDAADANIANNDTTTEAGYVADARIVKKHGDEIDSLADHAFLAKYGLLNKETVIADGTSGGKVITVTTDDAVVTTTFSLNAATGVKTITDVIITTSGSYKYTKTSVITPTKTGKTIKESYIKEDK